MGFWNFDGGNAQDSSPVKNHGRVHDTVTFPVVQAARGSAPTTKAKTPVAAQAPKPKPAPPSPSPSPTARPSAPRPGTSEPQDDW